MGRQAEGRARRSRCSECDRHGLFGDGGEEDEKRFFRPTTHSFLSLSALSSGPSRSTSHGVNLSRPPLSSLNLSPPRKKKQGYVEAAAAFAEESGTRPCSDLSAAAGRHAVRSALSKGDVGAALAAINDADATLLDRRPALGFALQQQRAIELCRQGDVEGALAHAREYLAPAAGVGGSGGGGDGGGDGDGDGDEEMAEEGGGGEATRAAAAVEREQERAAAAAAAALLLPELERTVALLAFDDPASSPLADLLSQQQRSKTAAMANAAMLEASGSAGAPRLPELVKMLAWAQARLGERGVRFPRMEDPATAALVGP